MMSAAKRTFPNWRDTLSSELEDCSLNYDDKRAALDVHPLDDYYFAGVVALEASKIRQLFSEEQARELLGLIGEQVDAVAQRKDRAISDLVFHIIGKVDLTVTADSQKMPYDEVVSSILRHMGIDKIDATKHLMSDALFRHTLGEPLALGIPHWWQSFKSKYDLQTNRASDITPPEVINSSNAAKPNGINEDVRARPPRNAPRRAVAF